MIDYMAAVVALVAAGAAIGIVAVVSLGIRSDERAFRRAMAEAKGRIAHGAARLTDKRMRPPIRPGIGAREDIRI